MDAPTYHIGDSVIFRALPSLLAFCVCIGCERPNGLSESSAPPCVYLVSASHRKFSLGFAHQTCRRAGYVCLPVSEFDSVANWAYNARAAGFLPAIAQFRIVARMASQDERSDWNFSVHGGGFWRRYWWAEWTTRADWIAGTALKNDSLVNALLELPLSRAGLADVHGLHLSVRKVGLSHSIEMQLNSILPAAELRLQILPAMLRIARSLEEAIQLRPEYAPQRRRIFTVYAIE